MRREAAMVRQRVDPRADFVARQFDLGQTGFDVVKRALLVAVGRRWELEEKG